MGALGVDGIRRGEFVSKRVAFEGVVADPALDGGVAACCVSNAADGTKKGLAGVSVVNADAAATRRKPRGREGAFPFCDCIMITQQKRGNGMGNGGYSS